MNVCTFRRPETAWPLIDRAEIFLRSAVDRHNNSSYSIFFAYTFVRVYARILMIFYAFVCLRDLHTPPRWQRRRWLKPHPTPYAETEAEAHNERKRCWARTKQIDVANAGGGVLPLFFAISPRDAAAPLHHTQYDGVLCFILRRCLPHSLAILSTPTRGSPQLYILRTYIYHPLLLLRRRPYRPPYPRDQRSKLWTTARLNDNLLRGFPPTPAKVSREHCSCVFSFLFSYACVNTRKKTTANQRTSECF